ncbi:GDP-mannose 4,6-dehydratase [Gracilibacillus sp. Marseille-QA3620]
MKVLVTGANGFVGSYLVSELMGRGHAVVAGVRNEWGNIPVGVETCSFQLGQIEEMKEALRQTEPDVIFHLAGQSNVPLAWNDPAATLQVNAVGTVELIKAAYETVPEARIFTVGSSEEYGIAAKEHELLHEGVECKPQNPYASSKFIAGQVGMQLARKYGVNLIHLRPFNHFGPNQRKGFVISDFSSQIAAIEAGQMEPIISVGNLEAWRDFMDVRDIVRAYALLIEKEGLANGIYNVSSGTARKVGDILQRLIELSTVSIEVVVDPAKYRPNEVERFAGSNKKLQEAVDWKTQYAFDDSLRNTLHWWRNKYKKTIEQI